MWASNRTWMWGTKNELVAGFYAVLWLLCCQLDWAVSFEFLHLNHKHMQTWLISWFVIWFKLNLYNSGISDTHCLWAWKCLWSVASLINCSGLYCSSSRVSRLWWGNRATPIVQCIYPCFKAGLTKCLELWPSKNKDMFMTPCHRLCTSRSEKMKSNFFLCQIVLYDYVLTIRQCKKLSSDLGKKQRFSILLIIPLICVATNWGAPDPHIGQHYHPHWSPLRSLFLWLSTSSNFLN